MNPEELYSEPHERRARYAASALHVVAVLVVAGVLLASAWFDVLGVDQKRADNAARDAAATLLCINRDAFSARLRQVNADAARADGIQNLTTDEQNLRRVLVTGLADMARAQRQLGVECSPVQNQSIN